MRKFYIEICDKNLDIIHTLILVASDFRDASEKLFGWFDLDPDTYSITIQEEEA